MQDDLFISRREILSILFRRKKSMAWIIILTVSLAAFSVYYLISPSYGTGAVVLLNNSFLTQPLRDAPPPSDFEKLVSFHTQRDILESTRLATEAVRRINLAETRVIGRVERIKIALGNVKRKIGHLLGIKRWQTPWSAESAAISAVDNWLRTAAVPDSNAIEVSYRAKNPVEAVKVVNAILEIHSEYFNASVRKKATGVISFLEEEFEQNKNNLQRIEQELLEFRLNDQFSLDSAPLGQEKLPSFIGIADNTKVQEELKLYVLKMEEEIRIASQLDNNNKRQRIINDLKSRMARYLEVINAIPKRELQLVRLRREFEHAQDDFSLLQRNLTRARLVATGQTEVMNLVDVFEPPEVKTSPIAPKKRIIVILSLFMGIVLSLTWAFVADYFDHRLRNAEELKRYLGLRLIASLPDFSR